MANLPQNITYPDEGQKTGLASLPTLPKPVASPPMIKPVKPAAAASTPSSTAEMMGGTASKATIPNANDFAEAAKVPAEVPVDTHSTILSRPKGEYELPPSNWETGKSFMGQEKSTPPEGSTAYQLPASIGGGTFLKLPDGTPQDPNKTYMSTDSNQPVTDYAIREGGKLGATDYQIDHVVPLWLGGLDTAFNKRVYSLNEHARRNIIDTALRELLKHEDITKEEAVVFIKNSEYLDVSQLPEFKVVNNLTGQGNVSYDQALAALNSWRNPKTPSFWTSALAAIQGKNEGFNQLMSDPNQSITGKNANDDLLGYAAKEFLKGGLFQVGTNKYRQGDPSNLPTPQGNQTVKNLVGGASNIAGSIASTYAIGSILGSALKALGAVTTGGKIVSSFEKPLEAVGGAFAKTEAAGLAGEAARVTTTGIAKSKVPWAEILKNTLGGIAYNQAAISNTENNADIGARFRQGMMDVAFAPLSGVVHTMPNKGNSLIGAAVTGGGSYVIGRLGGLNNQEALQMGLVGGGLHATGIITSSPGHVAKEADNAAIAYWKSLGGSVPKDGKWTKEFIDSKLPVLNENLEGRLEAVDGLTHTDLEDYKSRLNVAANWLYGIADRQGANLPISLGDKVRSAIGLKMKDAEKNSKLPSFQESTVFKSRKVISQALSAANSGYDHATLGVPAKAYSATSILEGWNDKPYDIDPPQFTPGARQVLNQLVPEPFGNGEAVILDAVTPSDFKKSLAVSQYDARSTRDRNRWLDRAGGRSPEALSGEYFDMSPAYAKDPTSVQRVALVMRDDSPGQFRGGFQERPVNIEVWASSEDGGQFLLGSLPREQAKAIAALMNEGNVGIMPATVAALPKNQGHVRVALTPGDLANAATFQNNALEIHQSYVAGIKQRSLARKQNMAAQAEQHIAETAAATEPTVAPGAAPQQQTQTTAAAEPPKKPAEPPDFLKPSDEQKPAGETTATPEQPATQSLEAIPGEPLPNPTPGAVMSADDLGNIGSTVPYAPNLPELKPAFDPIDHAESMFIDSIDQGIDRSAMTAEVTRLRKAAEAKMKSGDTAEAQRLLTMADVHDRILDMDPFDNAIAQAAGADPETYASVRVAQARNKELGNPNQYLKLQKDLTLDATDLVDAADPKDQQAIKKQMIENVLPFVRMVQVPDTERQGRASKFSGGKIDVDISRKKEIPVVVHGVTSDAPSFGSKSKAERAMRKVDATSGNISAQGMEFNLLSGKDQREGYYYNVLGFDTNAAKGQQVKRYGIQDFAREPADEAVMRKAAEDYVDKVIAAKKSGTLDNGFFFAGPDATATKKDGTEVKRKGGKASVRVSQPEQPTITGKPTLDEDSPEAQMLANAQIIFNVGTSASEGTAGNFLSQVKKGLGRVFQVINPIEGASTGETYRQMTTGQRAQAAKGYLGEIKPGDVVLTFWDGPRSSMPQDASRAISAYGGDIRVLENPSGDQIAQTMKLAIERSQGKPPNVVLMAPDGIHAADPAKVISALSEGLGIKGFKLESPKSGSGSIDISITPPSSKELMADESLRKEWNQYRISKDPLVFNPDTGTVPTEVAPVSIEAYYEAKLARKQAFMEAERSGMDADQAHVAADRAMADYMIRQADAGDGMFRRLNPEEDPMILAQTTNALMREVENQKSGDFADVNDWIVAVNSAKRQIVMDYVAAGSDVGYATRAAEAATRNASRHLVDVVLGDLNIPTEKMPINFEEKQLVREKRQAKLEELYGQKTGTMTDKQRTAMEILSDVEKPKQALISELEGKIKGLQAETEAAKARGDKAYSYSYTKETLDDLNVALSFVKSSAFDEINVPSSDYDRARLQFLEGIGAADLDRTGWLLERESKVDDWTDIARDRLSTASPDEPDPSSLAYAGLLNDTKAFRDKAQEFFDEKVAKELAANPNYVGEAVADPKRIAEQAAAMFAKAKQNQHDDVRKGITLQAMNDLKEVLLGNKTAQDIPPEVLQVLTHEIKSTEKGTEGQILMASPLEQAQVLRERLMQGNRPADTYEAIEYGHSMPNNLSDDAAALTITAKGGPVWDALQNAFEDKWRSDAQYKRTVEDKLGGLLRKSTETVAVAGPEKFKALPAEAPVSPVGNQAEKPLLTDKESEKFVKLKQERENLKIEINKADPKSERFSFLTGRLKSVDNLIGKFESRGKTYNFHPDVYQVTDRQGRTYTVASPEAQLPVSRKAIGELVNKLKVLRGEKTRIGGVKKEQEVKLLEKKIGDLAETIAAMETSAEPFWKSNTAPRQKGETNMARLTPETATRVTAQEYAAGQAAEAGSVVPEGQSFSEMTPDRQRKLWASLMEAPSRKRRAAQEAAGTLPEVTRQTAKGAATLDSFRKSKSPVFQRLAEMLDKAGLTENNPDTSKVLDTAFGDYGYKVPEDTRMQKAQKAYQALEAAKAQGIADKIAPETKKLAKEYFDAGMPEVMFAETVEKRPPTLNDWLMGLHGSVEGPALVKAQDNENLVDALLNSRTANEALGRMRTKRNLSKAEQVAEELITPEEKVLPEDTSGIDYAYDPSKTEALTFEQALAEAASRAKTPDQAENVARNYAKLIEMYAKEVHGFTKEKPTAARMADPRISIQVTDEDPLQFMTRDDGSPEGQNVKPSWIKAIKQLGEVIGKENIKAVHAAQGTTVEPRPEGIEIAGQPVAIADFPVVAKALLEGTVRAVKERGAKDPNLVRAAIEIADKETIDSKVLNKEAAMSAFRRTIQKLAKQK